MTLGVEVKNVGLVVFDAMVALVLSSIAYIVIKHITPDKFLEQNHLALFVHLISVTVAVYIILRVLQQVRKHYMPRNLMDEAGNVILVSVSVLLVDWDKLKTVVESIERAM